MIKVVVTGASGFIGSHVAKYLLSRGVDVLSVGRTEPDFAIRHFKHDLMNGDHLLVELLQGADIVIHMAAVPAATPDMDVEDINVRLTRSMYSAAKSASVPSFLLLSSVKAVAEKSSSKGPLDDTVVPNPYDAYGRSKLACESIVRSVGEGEDIAVTIIRAPLVYGPGVKGNFRALVKMAALPCPLPLAGLSAERSLLYVDNLSDLIFTLSAKGRVSGVYYACDGEDVSTGDLISIIRANLGNKAGIFYVPVFAFKFIFTLVRRRDYFDKLFSELKVSNTELEKNLGWKPLYTLEQGLKLTLNSKQ
jgi:nucleoside-diphosphate-sugar epimerase